MGWVECLAVKRHLLLVEFFLSKLHLFQRSPHQIWLLLFPILFVWTDYYLSGLFTQMKKSAEIFLLTCLVQTTPPPSSLSCAGYTTAANRAAAPEDREYCSAAEVQLPLFSSTTVKTFKKAIAEELSVLIERWPVWSAGLILATVVKSSRFSKLPQKLIQRFRRKKKSEILERQ